jgi:guanine deaminase
MEKFRDLVDVENPFPLTFFDQYMLTEATVELGTCCYAGMLMLQALGLGGWMFDGLDRHGLLGPRSVYAHCIHLNETDRVRMAESRAVMSFCPTSNLFLGSGLFDRAAARRHGVHVALATDVGGGTSFSMLRTMHEAYKVVQLSGQTLCVLDAFHLASLGAASALQLDAEIGNLLPGKAADFAVLDPRATPLLARRFERARNLEERLFVLMMLGDDRVISATYVLGRRVHVR